MRREMNFSTVVPRMLVGFCAALWLLAFAAPAMADHTHKYLGQITLASGTNPQPSGVDPEGNIIVFLEDQEVIAKYDTDGNPVDFSALGTNVIDGKGGLECPDVPTDCDRVPAGHLGPFQLGPVRGVNANLVVVDSSGGPANGYIYVRNHNRNTLTGEIDVFAPSGMFLGTINEALAQPRSDPDMPAESISIAPNGSVYVSRAEQGALGNPRSGSHVDWYAPIDSDPAHDQFLGQARFAYQYPVEEVNFTPFNVIGAGANGVFVLGSNFGADRGLGNWRWYSPAELQKPGVGYSIAKDYLPFPADNLVEDYGAGAVNPTTENIQLFGPNSGMVIWDQTAHKKVGPTIATGGQIAAGARSIAFDASGGPDNGRFYVKGGSNSLSVFSGPVVIPDIDVGNAEPGHKSVNLNLDIGTAGGPAVTACEVEYGLEKTYGATVPCAPAAPYGSDIEVSAKLPGLFTEATYHYRIRATNENGFNLTDDSTVRTVAVLDVSTGAVTNLDQTGATFNGSLDPDGLPTSYRFQYGVDKHYDLETPSASAGSESGLSPVAPVDVEELQPGRTYHYRLVAENELGTTLGPDRTFTVPAKPAITNLNADNVSATAADIHASVNDFASASEYHFEYGPTGIYGQSTPSQQLPADASYQVVSAQIGELQPGITYNFRLVASNQYGTSKSINATFDFSPPSCPNSHVRQQVGAGYLPDCRAYELVSPSRAGSIQLFPGDFSNLLTGEFIYSDPETFPTYRNSGYATAPARFGFYGGLGGLVGTDSPNYLFDHYLATRTTRGWTSSFAGLHGDQAGLTFNGQCSLTLDKCIDYKAGGLEGKVPFPYVWDSNGQSLGRWPTNFSVVPEADHLTGDQRPSGDFTHFVFSSLDLAFVPGGLESAPGSVYDNAVDLSTLTIASKLPNGDDIPQDAGGPGEFIKVPAVSRDGSHILMSTVAPGGKANLYMRVDDSITYEVSGGNGVELIGMSPDGSTVAFTSKSALTPEDTDTSKDLYLWREEADGATLTLVSQGNGHGNSDGCNANWTQYCDVAPITPLRPDIDDVMAAEGDVYFYSPEQLDPENPGVLNQRNLYHLRDGEVQYVTTFDPGTQADRMQISADGQHAAFLTKAELTGYDSTYFDSFGVERTALEMYAFDAASGDLQCASCNPTGAPPTVPRSDPPANETGATSTDAMASKSGPFMADDGRVAFATAESLVPRDTNGRIDVYEFVGGRSYLISAGTGDRDLLPKLALLYPGQNTGLEAVSRDGVDIYFSTFDTLVPQDQNGEFIKFYDARTGGGFPVQGELLPCEAADECHGPTSTPATNPEIGTGIPYSVSGNAQQTGSTRETKRKRHLRKKKKRTSRHSQRRISVRGNG